jgi:RNA polymerase sigma-70 factor (ECF subfamily)
VATTGDAAPADTTPADEVLVARALAGERDAFGAIYGRYHAGIHRFARAMTGSTTLAEDVTQEVFLELIRTLDRYDAARGALSTYLYAIARNVSRYRLRRERRFVAFDRWMTGEPAIDEDPSRAMVQSEDVARVRTFIKGLSSRYREVLILCDLQSFSYEAAAAVLNVRIGTVKSRLHRARQQLARRLTRADLAISPIREGTQKCLI